MSAKLSELSSRLMPIADTLLSSQSKEDLYTTILDGATQLSKATQGSVMVIDHNGEDMHVVYAKGISTALAQYATLRVGLGIAGKVAKSGTAIVVDDVENDPVTAMPNRPRFRSKSLLSIPLKLNEKVLGVLNLSDKEDFAAFSEEDVKMLTLFSTLASLVIERTIVLEDATRLEHLSHTDPLTGIFNRRFLATRLQEEMNRSIRHGLQFSVVFIDLDYFKNYNDTLGHLAGDAALRETAGIIKTVLREMDIVARYGGEEFCVLLPETRKQLAQIVAERIRKGVEKKRFSCGKGLTDARLTASLGIASFPEDGDSVTSLLSSSDTALYVAKSSGRNRVAAAEPSRDTQGRLQKPGCHLSH